MNGIAVVAPPPALGIDHHDVHNGRERWVRSGHSGTREHACLLLPADGHVGLSGMQRSGRGLGER
jgi:hypothetical protein